MTAIGPLAPPPYIEPAPDGNSYFKYLRGYVGLAESYAHAFRTRQSAQAIPHPQARAIARLLGLFILDLEDQVRGMEIAVAESADLAIKARIRATTVRPVSSAHGGLLINRIKSRAVGGFKLPVGAVGIADISQLDQVADVKGRPFWRAQEFGSRHLVGRLVTGFYQPGQVAPDAAQFREQSSFLVQRGGATMRIKRPIPERAFLRAGAADAERFRYRLVKQITKDAVAEIDRIAALGALRVE